MTDMTTDYKFVHAKRKGSQGCLPLPAPERRNAAVKAPETFLGMPCKKITAVVPPIEERKARRNEFNMNVRAKFLEHLAKTQRPQLKALGLTDRQIAKMKKGRTPAGFNTHHKVSIYAGGSNDFSNLLLIRDKPYHAMVHYHLINPQMRKLEAGDKRSVVFPIPEGNIYIPDKQFRHLQRDAEDNRVSYGKTGKEYCEKNFNKPFMDDVRKAEAFAHALLKKARGR